MPAQVFVESERRARSSGLVTEREVLRIAAVLLGLDPAAAMDAARREVLAWAQNRSGSKLPKEAWDLESFEHMTGGRNSAGVRLRVDDHDLWTVRADDPDKNIPGRIWTHEVTIGSAKQQQARFSVRQIVSTAERSLEIEPHSPGFIRQVVERCGLLCRDYRVAWEPWAISSEDDISELLEALDSPSRLYPIFVLTVPAGESSPLLDARSLAQATMGIARVAVVPDQLTWFISERLGKARSAFGGAARAYLPGFSPEADPYAHRLFLAAALAQPSNQTRAEVWMRSIAAYWSVRASQLGSDVLAFSSIRNASLRVRQEQLSSAGAAEGEQISLAKARIYALEEDLKEAENYQNFFDKVATEERLRAETAEAQYRSAAYRIQQLETALNASGVPMTEERRPENWSEFITWCDATLAGRLLLAPAARRGAKQAEFENVTQVARCLFWLATEYRDGRLNGISGDFRDFYIEEGVRNSPCGSDEFEFDNQGRRYIADWHIKSGGNTRDPRRALRIYYCWDEDTGQVVIADLPGHRATGAS